MRMIGKIKFMNRLAAQVTHTDASTDNAYLVTQLESNATGGYAGTGGLIWIDKALPDAEKRLSKAVLNCLASRFTGHRKL